MCVRTCMRAGASVEIVIDTLQGIYFQDEYMKLQLTQNLYVLMPLISFLS